MKVCVVGGKLQGTEALYLASKAGMETVLIDRDNNVPGQKFCCRFIRANVVNCCSDIMDILQDADFVLPALENAEALNALKELAETYSGINLVYDEDAYAVSSSKQKSDRAFAAHGIACPVYYPGGSFPYIAKPSSLSGSVGVQLIEDKSEMDAFLEEHDLEEWVIQEFISGPSYSLEIIGVPGNYRTYHVTELFMDSIYDCKRVLSCPDIPDDIDKQLRDITLKLGEMVQLHGVMDVEVIERNGILYVLEIDARLPSQTPINVYQATGINFMSELAGYFGKGKAQDGSFDNFNNTDPRKGSYVCLEHIRVRGNDAEICGEHIMSEAGPLEHLYNFCGADEALTDYTPDAHSWAATLIFSASSRSELETKLRNIRKELALIRKCDEKDITFKD